MIDIISMASDPCNAIHSRLKNNYSDPELFLSLFFVY